MLNEKVLYVASNEAYLWSRILGVICGRGRWMLVKAATEKESPTGIRYGLGMTQIWRPGFPKTISKGTKLNQSVT